ncbi:MAG: sensor histidine kinase N-terminal domain-containing protein [Sulfuritalea sp.]|nr:sensor histidine kinase N-terminal domain-containing protein [Sulfuritalea sp.]
MATGSSVDAPATLAPCSMTTTPTPSTIRSSAPTAKLIQGDPDVPPPSLRAKPEAGTIRFRDERIDGETVRVAYAFIPVGGERPPLVVQVAGNPAQAGEALSSSIFTVCCCRNFPSSTGADPDLPGLARGIAPLGSLRDPDPRSPARRPVADTRRSRAGRVRSAGGGLQRNDGAARGTTWAQQRFIAEAAHQMRTPLTGLRMQTEIALSETDPRGCAYALQLIAGKSTDRASRMVNSVADAGPRRGEPRKLHRVVPLDLDATARVAEEWVVRALAKRIDFGFEDSGRPLCGSRGSAAAVAQEMLDNFSGQRDQVHPAGRPCHGAHPCRGAGGDRGRGRRHRHPLRRARQNLRTLLPRAGHRLRRAGTGTHHRRRDRRTAPRQHRSVHRQGRRQGQHVSASASVHRRSKVSRDRIKRVYAVSLAGL